MYEKFYGLKQSPFGMSPNPSFYYPTPRHDEAWANLWCGIQQRKGCVVMTGEVGTGKTLLVRRVMNELDRTKIRYAYLFNPKMTPDDFFSFVLADLGVNVSGSRGQMLAQLNKYLLNICNQKSTVALIIDEAHLLSREMLEEVRLLTNLENSQHKLMQILLVGQPELDSVLEHPELRQLKQRVALRCRLEPLNSEEITNYISSRLQKARAASEKENKTIFSHAALEQIRRYSHGIPRIINTLCENALITGYARQCPMISAEMIEQVAKDFHLEPQDDTDMTAANGASSDAKAKAVASSLTAVFKDKDSRETSGGPKVQ